MISVPVMYLYVYPMAVLGFVLIGARYLMLGCVYALLVAVPAAIVWKVVALIFGA